MHTESLSVGHVCVSAKCQGRCVLLLMNYFKPLIRHTNWLDFLNINRKVRTKWGKWHEPNFYPLVRVRTNPGFTVHLLTKLHCSLFLSLHWRFANCRPNSASEEKTVAKGLGIGNVPNKKRLIIHLNKTKNANMKWHRMKGKVAWTLCFIRPEGPQFICLNSIFFPKMAHIKPTTVSVRRDLRHHAVAVLWWVTQSCSTLGNPMDCSPPGSSVHGDSPGKTTGVGCHALLQGIFPTQGWNPGLQLCRPILYWLPTPVLLSGKFHGWRSPVGYSPWDCKESDMTEQLHSLTLYRLSYQGSPTILWWVAYLFSRELWSPVPLGSDVALQGPRASSSFLAML